MKSMSGTISNIDNHGSIVVVWLKTPQQISPVYFDHRPFRHLLDGENCNAADLIGRAASYEDEIFSFED